MSFRVGARRIPARVSYRVFLSALPALSVLAATPVTLHAQIRGVLVDAPRVGQPSPALILPFVTASGIGVGPYELEQELGRTVVLGFCVQVSDPGCSALWRYWQRADSVYGEGVSVVGVSGETLGVVAEFARREAVPGRLLADERGVSGRRWGVPGGGEERVAVFVVAWDGLLAYRDLQFRPDDLHARQRLETAILAARPAAPPE